MPHLLKVPGVTTGLLEAFHIQNKALCRVSLFFVTGTKGHQDNDLDPVKDSLKVCSE